ncbi:MAG: heme-binding protein [Spirochaetaceae bacterium]|jgi:uncharacterized protein (UPF0303 family)|nr:heme-binding protein [Spirochaetaceae bacterium]
MADKLEKLIEIMEKQEDLLQFSRFNRQDAWDLGHTFADVIRERKLPAPVSIRLTSGLVVFQWAGEGTNPDNEYWMIRKFRLVRDTEKSTLLNAAYFKKKGETLESRGLDPRRYAVAGGGFPLRIKESGLAGVVTVSGLPQLEDHALLIEGISRHLGVKAPALPRGTKF